MASTLHTLSVIILIKITDEDSKAQRCKLGA